MEDSDEELLRQILGRDGEGGATCRRAASRSASRGRTASPASPIPHTDVDDTLLDAILNEPPPKHAVGDTPAAAAAPATHARQGASRSPPPARAQAPPGMSEQESRLLAEMLGEEVAASPPSRRPQSTGPVSEEDALLRDILGEALQGRGGRSASPARQRRGGSGSARRHFTEMTDEELLASILEDPAKPPVPVPTVNAPSAPIVTTADGNGVDADATTPPAGDGAEAAGSSDADEDALAAVLAEVEAMPSPSGSSAGSVAGTTGEAPAPSPPLLPPNGAEADAAGAGGDGDGDGNASGAVLPADGDAGDVDVAAPSASAGGATPEPSPKGAPEGEEPSGTAGTPAADGDAQAPSTLQTPPTAADPSPGDAPLSPAAGKKKGVFGKLLGKGSPEAEKKESKKDAKKKGKKDREKKVDRRMEYAKNKAKETETTMAFFDPNDLSLDQEKKLLEQILDDMMNEDVSTPADSELGLNDTITDVETVLRNAERIAEARSKKENASDASSMQPDLNAMAESVLKHANFPEVTTELNQRQRDIGWPICLGVAPHEDEDGPRLLRHLQQDEKQPSPASPTRAQGAVFAVGTSGGAILLFNRQGRRCGMLGGAMAEESTDRGGCVCLDMHCRKDMVVAGFQTGDLVFFDIESGQVLKSSREGAAPFHSVQWVGVRNRHVVVLDILGHFKLVTLKKQPALNLKTKYSIATQPIAPEGMTVLEFSCVTIFPNLQAPGGDLETHNILAFASRNRLQFHKLKSTSQAVQMGQAFYEFENRHFVPPKVLAQEEAELKQEKEAERADKEAEKAAAENAAAGGRRRSAPRVRRDPVDLRRRLRAHRKRVQRAESLPAMSWLADDVDPMLILAWYDHAYVFRLNRKATQEGQPQIAHSVTTDQMVLQHPCVALVFLSSHVVTVVDSHGGITAVDPRASKRDHLELKLEPSSVSTGRDGRSCRQAVKCYTTAPARPRGLSRDTQLHREMLVLCRQPTKMVRVEVMPWKQRLNKLSPKREALLLAAEMKFGTAVVVTGLPREKAERERVLDAAIEELLEKYMEDQTQRGPTVAADADAWWKSLGRYLFKYLSKLNLTALIFKTLYPHFAEADRADIWVTLLEPMVLAGKVRGIPDFHVHLIAEWLARGGVLAYANAGPITFAAGSSKGGAPAVDVPYKLEYAPQAFTVDVVVRPREVAGDQCVACSVDCYERTGWAIYLRGCVWVLEIGDSTQFYDVYEEEEEHVLAKAMLWTRLTFSCDAAGTVLFYINTTLVGEEEVDYVPNEKLPMRIGGYIKETAPGSGLIERDSMPFKGDLKGFKLYSTSHAEELFGEVPDLYTVESEAASDAGGGFLECAPVESGISGLGWFGRRGESNGSAARGISGGRRSLTKAMLDGREGGGGDGPFVLGIDGVASVETQSEATVHTHDEDDALAPMRRLDNMLLMLEPAAMDAVGGHYTVVMELSQQYHLYRAFASYYNKMVAGGGFNPPLLQLYTFHREPMVGSVVEYANQKGQGGLTGTVETKEDKHVMVRWHTEGDDGDGCQALRIASMDVTPIPASPPNRKARKVLLQYLRCLLMGDTFYGEPVPRPTLPQVKAQALEFVFYAEGDDKNITARRYPVLEELLQLEGRGVFAALGVAFNDDSATSPWRRVLRGTGKAATLTDAKQMEDRFRLSRDQVAAVLLKKMHASEFPALEPKLTFERESPRPQDMVSLFELVALSISRRCVQVKKFSKDMVKRIVAHLAYQCPPERKIAVQQMLEAMLVVALDPANGCWTEEPSEDDINDLRKIAQQAGFILLQIYLYKRDANYSVVLRTYLKACLNDHELDKGSLFNFLEETLESLKGDPTMAEHQYALQEAVLEHLEELVKVDSSEAAAIVVRHLQFKHNDIMFRLGHDKKTQYAYLKGIIEASEKKNDETNIATGLDPSTIEKYIRLLWHFDESNILPFLKKYEANIEIPRILATIERLKQETERGEDDGTRHESEGDGREDVSVYLYSRTGRFTEALDLLLKRLQKTMRYVRITLLKQVKLDMFSGYGRVHGGTIARVSADLGVGARGLKFGAFRRGTATAGGSISGPVVPAERRGSEVSEYGKSSLIVNVLDSREGRTVSDLITLGLDICKVSMRDGVADACAVWFSLLAKFIKPKKVLSEIENTSRKLRKAEDIVASCVALVAAVVILELPYVSDDEGDEPDPFARNRSITSFSAIPKLNTHEDEEQIIDELAEVELEAREAARQQQMRAGHALRSGRARATKPRKLLEQSLSEPLLMLNQKMQELYAHYINEILLDLMATHNAQASHDRDEAEINDHRRKVNNLRRKHGKQHLLYKEERAKLSAATERIEMVVLKKIINEHSDSTFNEFKTVLTGIMENARTEKSLQTAFYDVLGGDIHTASRKLISAHQAAAYPRTEGLPPWAPVCGACKMRLNERSESTAFKCAHVFHRQCLYRAQEDRYLDVCLLCVGKSKQRKGQGKAPPAAAGDSGTPEVSPTARASSKAIRRRLEELNRPQARRLAEFQKTLKASGQQDMMQASVTTGRLNLAPQRWCVDSELDTFDDDDFDFDSGFKFEFDFDAPPKAPRAPQHTETLTSPLWGVPAGEGGDSELSD